MNLTEKYFPTDIDRKCCELELLSVGRRLDAPDHRYGPTSRDHHWLIFILSGEGIYEADGIVRRVKSGDMMVTFPNVRTSYRADEGNMWSIMWLGIAGERIADCLALAGVNRENPIARITDMDTTRVCLDAIMDKIDLGTLRSRFECASHIYRLLSLFSSTEQSEHRRDYIDEAILFMTNNYMESFTIGDLARQLCLDRSYFARKFAERVGLSPTRWLRDFRLAKSLDLLFTTDLTVSEIACSVGFTDPLYFTRCFGKKYGLSPSAKRGKSGNAT